MIYLDNAATSWPKPPAVAREMERFMREESANPGRAGYRMAVAAERRMDEVRRKLCRLFNAPDPNRMIFCSNCTDALNMAMKGVLTEGDHVVTTTIEHNSISRPLTALVERGQIEVTWVRVGGGGRVDPDDVRKAFRSNTKLVACLHASNVTGILQPVAEIGAMVRTHGALFLLDAAQTAGEFPISLEEMSIDLLAFPGHKGLLGPMGTGGLYVGERAKVEPWREGGTGGDSSSPSQPREFPYILEGGTPNAVGIAGLGAALDEVSVEAALTTARTLLRKLVDGISGDSKVSIVGNPEIDARVGTISLNVEGLSPDEAGAILDDSFDIAVRPGLHCAPGAHRELGTFPDGTIRVSPGPFNTASDIDDLVKAMSQLSA